MGGAAVNKRSDTEKKNIALSAFSKAEISFLSFHVLLFCSLHLAAVTALFPWPSVPKLHSYSNCVLIFIFFLLHISSV